MGGRSRVIDLHSLEKTHLFGQKMASRLLPGAVLALFGPLGAGKTSFVQGLALGLELEAPIQSPTFTYLNIYEGRKNLYHFDLYRMKGPSDFFSMGFDEYFSSGGITAIEWPERLGALLPPQTISLSFSYLNVGRRVHLSSSFESDLIDSMASWD
jgi:tRNA threonylcarbamoyladenosine biosynthesis protein TsaE